MFEAEKGYWEGMPQKAQIQLGLEVLFLIALGYLFFEDVVLAQLLIVARIGLAVAAIAFRVRATLRANSVRRRPGLVFYTLDYAMSRRPAAFVRAVAIGAGILALLAAFLMTAR